MRNIIRNNITKLCLIIAFSCVIIAVIFIIQNNDKITNKENGTIVATTDAIEEPIINVEYSYYYEGYIAGTKLASLYNTNQLDQDECIVGYVVYNMMEETSNINNYYNGLIDACSYATMYIQCVYQIL